MQHTFAFDSAEININIANYELIKNNKQCYKSEVNVLIIR